MTYDRIAEALVDIRIAQACIQQLLERSRVPCMLMVAVMQQQLREWCEDKDYREAACMYLIGEIPQPKVTE